MTSSGDQDRVLRNFKYHAPKADQIARYGLLRDKARELALLILDNCPLSRERSLAWTKLEEVVMWSNASIARNEADCLCTIIVMEDGGRQETRCAAHPPGTPFRGGAA